MSLTEIETKPRLKHQLYPDRHYKHKYSVPLYSIITFLLLGMYWISLGRLPIMQRHWHCFNDIIAFAKSWCGKVESRKEFSWVLHRMGSDNQFASRSGLSHLMDLHAHCPLDPYYYLLELQNQGWLQVQLLHKLEKPTQGTIWMTISLQPLNQESTFIFSLVNPHNFNVD